MTFHEQRPWEEPQRRIHVHGHVVIGVLITLAVVIVGALISPLIVAEVVGLAVFTVLVLAVGSWVGQRRKRNQ
ncbi:MULTISPECIES: hypothetical protein [unclassified Streptomyces]|uniref:hypothetical protein n=1 Tax=unclassified Streptomyces TaxID=2593676 RepID=UPI000DBAB827|nr:MULTISPECIES: hypothetical protein [unclassified Streptomyces]MYT68205.1 hypothetical protein [Streptomyces sp. SID8367]RAJ76833.1 hypothetical protein K377_06001 [Streptomyces sp. PsTaAH-137]